MNPEEQRKNIKTLLITDYWRAEADAIMEYAEGSGWTLDQIAYAFTRFGVDAVLMTLFVTSISDWSLLSLKGPDNSPGGIPLIQWGAIYFGA